MAQTAIRRARSHQHHHAQLHRRRSGRVPGARPTPGAVACLSSDAGAAARVASGKTRPGQPSARRIRTRRRSGGDRVVDDPRDRVRLPAPCNRRQSARRRERWTDRCPGDGHASVSRERRRCRAGWRRGGDRGDVRALRKHLPGYGYTAIAVALLANLDPLAVIASGIFFGALEAGAAGMQRDAGVPSVVVSAVEASIILAILAAAAARGRTRWPSPGIRQLLRRSGRPAVRPPAAGSDPA